MHRLGTDGLVRDWLVAGPWASPLRDLGSYVASVEDPFVPGGRWLLSKNPEADALKLRVATDRPPVHVPPPSAEEHRPVGWEGREGHWRRVRVGEDGYVDFSGFAFTPEYRQAFAAFDWLIETSGDRALRITANGPVSLFIDGELVHVDYVMATQEPVARLVRRHLTTGQHQVAIVAAVVCLREYRFLLRLHLEEAQGDRVLLPSPGADPERSAAAEALLDEIGVRSSTATDDVWELTGPEGAAVVAECEATRRTLVFDGGRALLDLTGSQGNGADSVARPSRGERRVTISAGQKGASAQRLLTLIRLPSDYRGRARGGTDTWREEVLAEATEKGRGVTAALARNYRQRGSVGHATVAESVGMLTERADCADFEALALVNLLHRQEPGAWAAGLRDDVLRALRDFKYWIDQPGVDCMCYFTENHQLVYHSAELLVGELFGDTQLSNTGWSGHAHAQHAARRCRSWMDQRLRNGFTEFDSNTYLAIDVLALASLTELARSADLRRRATAMLDKALFQLGCNSWRGIQGSSHGRSYAQSLISARLEETAPIQRLCWGEGTLNENLLPAVLLATNERYQVPAAVRHAGAALPEEWWSQQRSAGTFIFETDLRTGPWESASVVWKTPDGMLASVQDYRPGTPGYQEHTWQATLGPEAVVFANHPANSSVDSSARPNYWAGSRLLPRVRQHRDAALALYRLPSSDPMGFTHAWFPAAAFDEWMSHGPWLIGRVGDGYVALASDGELLFRHAGVWANQEVRSSAGGRAWICQLGGRRTHGNLTAFRDSLHAPKVDQSGITYRTPDGRVLRLRWDEPWTVDGREDPVGSFPHMRNPLTDVPQRGRHMTIDTAEGRHCIDLEAGRRCDAED